MDRSRIFFRLAYLFGFKPWDSGQSPPELIEVLDRPSTVPGRALDLGCGTGTNVIELARRGWDAVGVDFTPRAISAAAGKAGRAEVSCRLLVGDVTRLSELGVAGPFQLLLDLGCFHSVPPGRRRAYVEEAARVAAPGAAFLLFAFSRGEGSVPDAPRAEVQERFSPDFSIDEVREGDPRWGQLWYFMTRRG